jgi:hypothetical protein
MPLWRLGALRLAAAAWLVGLLAAVLALERPAPLFVNLGAGDAAFARGFRGGWERDGLRQSGETMFRWTLDGSRIEVPVSAVSGSLTARLRLARFAPGVADVAIQAGGEQRDRWSQPSQGWRVREVALGAVRGPLAMTFRSESDDPEGLGLALDWVELTGARLIAPRWRVLAGLSLLLLGVPLLLGLWFRSTTAGCVSGAILSWAAAAVVFMDRLGGLVCLSRAGGPALLALMGLALAARALRRAWPALFAEDGARATVIPAAAVVVALVALSHPFYYYPDVDTHARYLAAARADPHLLIDPREYQARTGAWTRDVGGRLVAFPYSSAFHALAWPAAVFLGEEAAVKCVAATALGLTVLLVHPLARVLGFGAGAALLAQALLVLLPVTASRLALALFPTLLGQALELLLIVSLCRMIHDLAGRRSAWTLGVLLALAQAAYTGSLLNVGVLVVVLASLQTAAGDGRGAVRLLALYVVATTAVLAVQYARFLPVFGRDVLPHVGETGAAAGAERGGGIAANALHRLGLFYDVVYPLMLVPGLVATRGVAAPARRVVVAALLAGGALLVLRYAAPIVFRDAKEMELLAGPVAALAAGSAAWLWRRGGGARAAALLALLWASAWGVLRAAEVYGGRFVAVGR